MTDEHKLPRAFKSLWNLCKKYHAVLLKAINCKIKWVKMNFISGFISLRFPSALVLLATGLGPVQYHSGYAERCAVRLFRFVFQLFCPNTFQLLRMTRCKSEYPLSYVCRMCYHCDFVQSHIIVPTKTITLCSRLHPPDPKPAAAAAPPLFLPGQLSSSNGGADDEHRLIARYSAKLSGRAEVK